MATPPRPPNRISKRVLGKWENIVLKALRNEERRAEGEHGPSTESSASSNLVPQSLLQQTNIDLILQTADEIEPENPQVARILCEYAYAQSQNLDPRSAGRGVLQFKTGLLSIIKQKRSKKEGERIDRSQDIDIIQQYYKDFREKHKIEQLEYEDRQRQQTTASDVDPALADERIERKRKVYLIARILNEVVDAYKRDHPDELLDLDMKRVMEEDARKIRGFKAFNILPLETPGVANAFTNFPEVVGATRELEYITSPDLPAFPDDYVMPEERHVDVFDFLQYAFGFQADNVANQREHLILLLSNSQTRFVVPLDSEIKLDDAAITSIYAAMMDNYNRWCRFLRRDPVTNRSFTKQTQLLLTALYLLIWGEAANLRFLPECLCYIFHHMADEMYDLVGKDQVGRSRGFLPDSPHSFLDKVIKPIHEIVVAESEICEDREAPHSAWRNYDDFNEFFWAPSCFELSWPWRLEAGFFVKPRKPINRYGDRFEDQKLPDEPLEPLGRKRERKVGKTHFVEHRTGFHLYHSFHRLWIFLVCMLQGLTIFAFCNQRLHIRDLKYLLSVGPTFVIMKFIQSLLDVILMFGAYRSTRLRNISRMLIRFFWFAVLSVVIVVLYVKTLQEEASQTGKSTWFSIFYWVLGIYAGFQFFLALLLRIPWFRMQADKCSNLYAVQLIKWVHQERYYVGRGMYERTRDYLSYTLFWWIIGVCKFSFSYFLQIKPMVAPTRIIIGLSGIQYRWHDVISNSNHNATTLLSLWAPVVMIYFLDTQVWYTVISTLFGGLEGARMRLGEVRSLDMLRTRFASVPEAFVKQLQPPVQHPRGGGGPPEIFVEEIGTMSLSLGAQATKPKLDAIKFAPLWNEIINCLREEDLLSNRWRTSLIAHGKSVVVDARQQDHFWVSCATFVGPVAFVLTSANKVYVGCDLVIENKQASQEELWERIKRDPYLEYAVQEAYESLQIVLLNLLNENGRAWVTSIYEDMARAMSDREMGGSFNLMVLGIVLDKAAKLTEILASEPKKKEEKDRVDEEAKMREAAVRTLLDLYEVVMRDFVVDPNLRAKYEADTTLQAAKQEERLFSELAWPVGEGKIDVSRLNYILTIKDSALNVPKNLEARRRLQYFTNSLFMSMPEAQPVRKMFSFSVFTPYYAEDVMYSVAQLREPNRDGITTIFYLQKIFPDEWTNFLERMLPHVKPTDLVHCTENDVKDILELRLWASYRGQTLARTVRGMMYYKRALMLQGVHEGASTTDEEEGGLPLVLTSQGSLIRSTQAQAELKFTYVVSAQIYGTQKNSSEKADQEKAADISYLLKQYDSLRIAYIQTARVTKDGRSHEEYYSKLIKADPSGKDQEIYSIKLPGKVILGEGKPENQNHAIIFTRGEALQTIDMNQEHYLEETMKMRNLLQEFDSKKLGLHTPSILGVREHVFTGSVSSLAWFMSMQESSFVTLGQRVLAKPLKVRMHYGHPDVFNRIFHITRGGISKASKQINLSQDIFAGFNSTLRQGNITHHEYIQCGKGRDVGLNQIAAFEGREASGNGEQTLSRDVYRLGQQFDFFRMLSFFFTSVGFYFTTMLTVLTVYVFLYGKVYLALSGVDQSLKNRSNVLSNVALQAALDTQFLLQIGIFTVVPVIMNFVLEQGILRALINFFTMQLQLSSVFFTFSLGTRSHYFGRTILHGGAKYKPTGRGFVVAHIPFAENYRLYSRSHFIKAMEIIILLIVYLVYGAHDRTSASYILLTFSSWFLAISWLYAPYIFNPSGFEWQKTVQDFEDWTNWLYHKGGIGDEGKKSWEVWWLEEQAHIQTPRGRFWEIILNLRFFIFQYGVVYALHATGHDTNLSVYGYSWIVIVGILLLFKVFTFSQKASANFQLIVRLFQGILFLAIIAGVTVAIILTNLTIGDVFASALALIPTGWGLLSIAIAIRPVMKMVGLWKSIRGIARLYDAAMGTVVFIPIAFLSWFPFVSTFQTRLVFNQAFSRGLEISVLLAGNNPNDEL